jgi:hypothetical protein
MSPRVVAGCEVHHACRIVQAQNTPGVSEIEPGPRSGRIWSSKRQRSVMDVLIQDSKFAFRLLWKDRAYAVAIVLTLARCLGANATFAVVQAVLIRPLPFPQADGTDPAAWSFRKVTSPGRAS